MDCTSCGERLADFLLDELPESEAVLIQEHLSLCPSCMRTYKELKGTGKALEAVPAMRPVEGTPEFERAVRAQAAVELQQILARLPADKRLKLEARRAARMSRAVEKPPPPRPLVPVRLLLAAAAGCGLLALILAYPDPNASNAPRAPLGTLSLTVGRVEQFYQRANEPNTPVKEGKPVLAGDSFSTLENGRARFDTTEAGTFFLGPSSRATFRVQPPGTRNFVVVLERGEIGMQRPANAPVAAAASGEPAPTWEVRSEAGTVLLDLGTHAYLTVVKSGKGFAGELLVLTGSAEVLGRSGNPLGTVSESCRATLAADKDTCRTEPLDASGVPAWRLDLVSEGELAKLLGAKVKVLGRQNGALEAELIYRGQNQQRALEDWIREPAAPSPKERPGGFALPAATRLRHTVPFGAPLAIEFKLARESQGETSFAFGVLESADGGVAVDVAREAALQVREKGRTVRGAALPARAPSGKLERLRLEITRENGGLTALLSSAARKGDPLRLPHEKPLLAGALWLQSLGDAVAFDEVRISGLVPAEWLHQHLK